MPGDGSHSSRAMANGLSAEEAEALRQMQEEATQRSNGAVVYHIRCNREITWNYDELCCFTYRIFMCASVGVSIQMRISV